MEHSREVIRSLEDTGDGARGLSERRVRRVQLENFGETWYVFIKNQLRHLDSECLDGRREGLASPHGSYSWVTWSSSFSSSISNPRLKVLTSKNVFVYPCQLDIRLLRVRHNQAIHDSF